MPAKAQPMAAIMNEKTTAGPALSCAAFGSEREEARADDGADAERDQIDRPERALQLMLAALRFRE
jgi:hypothetical protein